jgi:hypothetical protein
MPPRPIPSLKILLIWRMVLLAFSDPLFVTSYICSITSVIFFFQTHQQNLNLIQPHFTFFSINPNYLSGYHKKWFEFQESKTKQNPFFLLCLYIYWRIERDLASGFWKTKPYEKFFLYWIRRFFVFRLGIYLYWLSEGRRERKSVSVCLCVIEEK